MCPLPFTDVDVYNPFRIYIQCLYCRGILSGYSDNTFLPYGNITRGQVAKVVSNSAAFSDVIPSTTQTFSDVPYGHPFWVYIERLVAHADISGYADNGTSQPCAAAGVASPCFLPSATVTRGQLARSTATRRGSPTTRRG